MGEIIKGKCDSCGYQTKSLYFGGGMSNFTTCCNYPAFDKDKEAIVMENIMNKSVVVDKNPNIVFYDETPLMDKKMEHSDYNIDWGEYKLYHEGYLCPKCKEFTLGFTSEGLWD